MDKVKSAEDLMQNCSSYVIDYPDPVYMQKPLKRISYNSKEVGDNCLFFCKGRGFKKKFLDEAIAKGAYMYVAEQVYDVAIPGIIVSDIRPVLAEVAACFYDYPEDDLEFFEITGTKGKTTTAYFLYAILNMASKKAGKGPVGMISSQMIFDGQRSYIPSLTTPEPFELFNILDACRDRGVKKIVMEVSSQALKMGRTRGIRPEQAAFLNISPDHVSEKEHPDFQDYFESKLKIFTGADKAFINLNSDAVGHIYDRAEALSKEVIAIRIDGLKGKKTIITAENAESKEADKKRENHPFYKSVDYLANNIWSSVEGSGFDLYYYNKGKRKKITISLSSPGQFNVENALMAAAMALEDGVDAEIVAKALADVKVAGRMESLESEDKSLMTIVDFAHNVISFDAVFNDCDLRFPEYKKIAVFGASGCKGYNRRFDMGRSAGNHMDHILITTDDSDTESPMKICRELAAGTEDSGKDVEIILDREKAVKKAYAIAANYREKGLKSLVLLLGKGAEDFQTVNGKNLPYPSDSDLALHYTKIFNKK